MPPLALSVVLYELPFLPDPRFVEVIVSPGAATVMDSCADAVCTGDPLSFTDTVNVAVPVAVGVPEITPPLDSANPAGRLPEANDQVYPGVPPLALSVVLYELAVCAAPRLVEVTVNVLVAVFTVIDSWADAVCAGDPLSFTDTVNVDLPFAFGVPEITPPLDSVKPAGKLPDAIDHV